MGFPRGGRLLVAFPQGPLKIEDLLLELLEACLEGGGVGRGAKAAALEHLDAERLRQATLERVELLGEAAVLLAEVGVVGQQRPSADSVGRHVARQIAVGGLEHGGAQVGVAVDERAVHPGACGD